MGAKFSKSRNTDKRTLKEDFDEGEPANHTVTHNNSVIHVNNKEIPLTVPNGRRHEELEEERHRDAAEIERLRRELEELKTQILQQSEQSKMLRADLDKFKREDEDSADKITREVENKLADKLNEERENLQDHVTQQIDAKFKEHDNSVKELIEANRTEIAQEVSQVQTSKPNEEVESLKESVRILSISTVIKNTAHLNFSPTEAMDTIAIKILLIGGTEKIKPKTITVQNLMRITTIHELKYHLAEKYKHLEVGELVIKWKGIELADAATLLEYGISNKDNLELEVRALVTYMIQVQMDKDTKFPVEVTPATKILSVKEWIHDHISIAVEKQQLKHGDNLLRDDKRLAQCQIGEGEIIRLEVCHIGYYTINIVCPSGAKYQIDVESKDTIDTVKLQVSIKQHMNISQFELLKGGMVAADTSKKLYEYGIVAGDTLHLRMITPPNQNAFLPF